MDEWQHMAGTYKRLGGSDSDDWNHTRANQGVNLFWIANSDNTSSLGHPTALTEGIVRAI
jgi:hypothetical protein